MNRDSDKKTLKNKKSSGSIKKLIKRKQSCHNRTKSTTFNIEKKEPVKVLKSISLKSFSFQYPIGRGGFGKVWKVEQKKTKVQYALKEMLKTRILHKRSVHSVMNERKILEDLRSPLLVNMHFAMQDRENLYLLLDLKTGGDLRYHLSKTKRFSEGQARFFVCCIVMGLQFIHTNDVIHRDIKPENLVFDDKGYLFITDFGIARKWVLENSKDTSGTPGYMAPEVLFRQNHTFSVDYFALGVILYEIIMRKRPYFGKDRNEIRDHVLSKQARISETVEGWSCESLDFTNRLLQRKASSRLGHKGHSEVCRHPWIRDFPWVELFNRTLVAPFVPKNQDNFDLRFINEWNDDVGTDINLEEAKEMFEGYTYDERVFVQEKGKHKKSLSLK